MVNGETPGAVTQKSTSRLWWPEIAVPAVLSIAGVIFAFHGFQDWLTRGLWVVVLVVPVGLVAYFSMTFARAIYLEGAGLWKDPQRPAIMAAFLIAAAGVLPIILEFVKKSRENASPSDIAAAVFPPLLFTFGASVAAYVLVYVSGKVSTFEHKADELVGKVNTALDQIDGFTKQASSASTAMAGLRERTDIASSVLLEVAGDLGPYLPTASKDRRLLAAVFSPIAHSAKGWFELARRQSGGQFGMILREVIVRVGESYFREDVFDVRRRRIVTNARNYTTFLYQTARAVIRLTHLLQFTTVTAVISGSCPFRDRTWH